MVDKDFKQIALCITKGLSMGRLFHLCFMLSTCGLKAFLTEFLNFLEEKSVFF